MSKEKCKQEQEKKVNKNLEFSSELAGGCKKGCQEKAKERKR